MIFRMVFDSGEFSERCVAQGSLHRRWVESVGSVAVVPRENSNDFEEVIKGMRLSNAVLYEYAIQLHCGGVSHNVLAWLEEAKSRKADMVGSEA